MEYEKYFLGVERQAPASLHKKTADALRHLETTRPRSTVLRFRLDGLRARFVTYGHYWKRVLTQIENGTHRRDVHRARRRLAVRDAEAGAQAPELASPSAAPPSGPEPAAEAPSAAAPRRSPPPPPSAIPGMDSAALRKLYDDFVHAKQAAGEDTTGLAYKALERKLAREAARLQERLGQRVRFEVAHVAGKVTLRARPLPKPA